MHRVRRNLQGSLKYSEMPKYPNRPQTRQTTSITINIEVVTFSNDPFATIRVLRLKCSGGSLIISLSWCPCKAFFFAHMHDIPLIPPIHPYPIRLHPWLTMAHHGSPAGALLALAARSGGSVPWLLGRGDGERERRPLAPRSLATLTMGSPVPDSWRAWENHFGEGWHGSLGDPMCKPVSWC